MIKLTVVYAAGIQDKALLRVYLNPRFFVKVPLGQGKDNGRVQTCCAIYKFGGTGYG